MPVRFVLGRAGTGKTRHCLDAILAQLDDPDHTQRLMLLVPEQASFQMERALALRAPHRGYWRAEVLSFSRLARRLFNETGAEPDTLRGSARAMVLRSVLADPTGPARTFGKAADRAGLLTELGRFIEMLLAEAVTPAQLHEAAATFNDKPSRRRVESLAAIAQAYLDRLGPDRVDPAQRLAAVRERLGRTRWLPGALIWVDGFAGFTGQELETLVALARHACRVTIALLVDPAAPAVQNPTILPDPLNLFARVEHTYQHLLRRCAEVGVTVEPALALCPRTVPRFAAAPRLARLEAALAEPLTAVSVLRRRDESVLLQQHEATTSPATTSPAATSAGRQVRILECSTHDDELRAAARYIREQIRTSAGQLRPRDFALIGRDLTPFVQRIERVFAEYGLPCFLDRRRSTATHALSRFVDALLDVLESDFAPRATLRWLRCDMLPISRRCAERLQNCIVADQPGGLAAWQRERWVSDALRFLPDGERLQLDDERRRLLAAVDALLEARVGGVQTGRAWSRALHEVLVALEVPERIESWIAAARENADWETAEVHRLAWDALCRTCEDAHDALADQPLTLSQFAAMLRAALRAETIGLAPPTLDQVLISSIERSRHPEIKCAWIFAFNEGVFPAVPGEDPLLTDERRQMLVHAGLPALPPRRDQSFAERMLAYIALTRPAQELVISYATTGDDGSPRAPSPLLDDVRQALPDLQIESVAADQPPVCLDEFARQLTRSRQAGGARRTRCEHLLTELCQNADISPRLDWLLRGHDYHNQTGAPVDLVEQGTNEQPVAWFGSITQVECYMACPFKYLARYALRLRPPPGPALRMRDLGREAHEILAETVKRAMGSGAVRDLSDEDWRTSLKRAITELSAKLTPIGGHRRPQDLFASEVLHELLEPLVLAHATRWRRGGCAPVACERRFGSADDPESFSALQIPIAGGRCIALRGIIDRIDACQHDGGRFWLIYDYKSSPQGLKSAFLTGARLQLYAYAAAAMQAESDMRLGGVFIAPLYADTREIEMPGGGEDEPGLLMAMFRPRGLFDESLARVLDPALGTGKSPVAAMQLTKKGDFHKWSDARPRGELESRIELARRTIAQSAAGIVEGRAEVAPLVEGRTLACRTCEYGAVCRFEPVFNRPRVAETTLPRVEDVTRGGPGEAE